MKCLYKIPFIFLFICSTPTWAQTSTVDSVKNVVNQLFAGMKKGDSTMVKDVFAEKAILQTISTRQTTVPVLVTGSIQQFLNAIGTPHTDVWDEKIRFDNISVDGALASVWAPYRFFLNDKFLHCGVNSFQLMRFAEGWKIIYLVDTRRITDCL
jgi:hypothetical protein